MQTKELIPMDDLGVFVNAKYEMLIDSRKVAEYFGREHKSVTRAIQKLLSDESGYSEEFRQCNFALTHYIDEQGKKQPTYVMTRDGFTALAMGFTGKKAAQFKEAYIKRFNEMESQITYLQSLRDQYRPLTDAIQIAHEEPKFYHYTRENDMLNRLVTGMSAKQLRASRGIPKDEPLRPHLSTGELDELDYLQRLDVGFVLAIQDYQQRKQRLEYLLMKRREKMSAKALPAS